MRRPSPKSTVGIVTIALAALAALAACSSGSHRATPAAPTTTRPASITTTTPSPPATGSATPTVTIGHWTGRRPVSIYFSGDSGDITSHLQWSSWNADRAVAHGTWNYLDCRPDCATGKSTPYPVTITLTVPVDGKFTRLVEQTSGPHGFTLTFVTPKLGQGACANADNNSCAFA